METFAPADNVIQLPSLPPELFNYPEASSRVKALVGTWNDNIVTAKENRLKRYIDFNVETLRRQGRLPQDATMIPDRIIDSNIKREKADALGFLNSGFRLAIFDCVSDPQLDSRQLEIEVTKGLTYDGWYQEFDSWEDGAELHGLGYIEIIYDPTKPLFVGFEHIPYDNLYYNKKSRNIQQSEFLVRKYEINCFMFESWAKDLGFDQKQIQEITQIRAEKKVADSQNVVVYRVFFKHNNCVYVCWMTDTMGSNWLKAPEKFYIGIHNVETLEVEELDVFPVVTRIYQPDENEVLVEHYGRAFFDTPQQEANTSLITSFVNASMRSSEVYASPKQLDDSSAEMKILENVKLVPRGIYSRPLEFWSLPKPDFATLQALQFFDTRNASQQGKQAFTVMNRQDARKTAKEMDLASNEQQKVTSTNLASFSASLRAIFVFSWRIIQSQALLDRIPLLLIPKQDMMGQPAGYENDKNKIRQVYDIRPAGDTDILQAEVETQKMMQDWPVIQTTPLAPKFLEDFIKLRYPRKATEYIAILQAGNPGKQLVTSLSTLLTASLENDDIPPEQQMQLKQLEQQVATYLQTP